MLLDAVRESERAAAAAEAARERAAQEAEEKRRERKKGKKKSQQQQQQQAQMQMQQMQPSHASPEQRQGSEGQTPRSAHKMARGGLSMSSIVSDERAGGEDDPGAGQQQEGSGRPTNKAHWTVAEEAILAREFHNYVVQRALQAQESNGGGVHSGREQQGSGSPRTQQRVQQEELTSLLSSGKLEAALGPKIPSKSEVQLRNMWQVRLLRSSPAVQSPKPPSPLALPPPFAASAASSASSASSSLSPRCRRRRRWRRRRRRRRVVLRGLSHSQYHTTADRCCSRTLASRVCVRWQKYTERLHVELVAARLGDGNGPSPRTVDVGRVAAFVIDSIRAEKQRRKSGKDKLQHSSQQQHPQQHQHQYQQQQQPYQVGYGGGSHISSSPGHAGGGNDDPQRRTVRDDGNTG
eukprot:COSAG05_NODE_329_length_11294_cov_59.570076_11_plen_407_part_00